MSLYSARIEGITFPSFRVPLEAANVAAVSNKSLLVSVLGPGLLESLLGFIRSRLPRLRLEEAFVVLSLTEAAPLWVPGTCVVAVFEVVALPGVVLCAVVLAAVDLVSWLRESAAFFFRLSGGYG